MRSDRMWGSVDTPPIAEMPYWYKLIVVMGALVGYWYWSIFVNTREKILERMEQDEFERKVGLK